MIIEAHLNDEKDPVMTHLGGKLLQRRQQQLQGLRGK